MVEKLIDASLILSSGTSLISSAGESISIPSHVSSYPLPIRSELKAFNNHYISGPGTNQKKI